MLKRFLVLRCFITMTKEDAIKKVGELFNIIKNNPDDAEQQLEKLLLFFEGAATNAPPQGKSSWAHLLLSVEIMKQLSKVVKDVNSTEDELIVRQDELEDVIKKLEERINKLETEKLR